jgi:hypothetical protein
MDPSELLSLQLSLHDALAQDGALAAAEVLLSAFAAATTQPSVCSPFPKHAVQGERRFSDARRLLDAVPPLRQLLPSLNPYAAEAAASAPPPPPQLPGDAWRLLQWLLLLLAPQRGSLRAAGAADAAREIGVPQLAGELSKCCCILRVERPDQDPGDLGAQDHDDRCVPPVYCFHGTNFTRRSS